MTGTNFTYKNARISSDRLSVFFDYRIDTDSDSFNMQESASFTTPLPDTPTTGRLIRALHLALGISYYKAFLPPKITHPYAMDTPEAEFWNSVFLNGLGELFYENKLPTSRLAKFSAQTGQEMPAANTDDSAAEKSALLGIGGGKDSIVAGELLKQLGIEFEGFVLATGSNTGQAADVADVMQANLLPIKRQIDRSIIDINKLDGAFNGHIPISLIFALYGCLQAHTSGHSYVIVANEASASIPQATWEDTGINHQWSKSLEFEQKFQDFIKTNVDSSLEYFSLVRPLTSVAIAKLFSGYPAYFEHFTSDNSVLKLNPEMDSHPRWSINSSKSLSSFILLAPWNSDQDMLRIFGRDFLNEEPLAGLIFDLLGEGESQILDCVGTPDELKESLRMLNEQSRYQDSCLLDAVNQGNILQGPDSLASLLTPLENHAIPDEIIEPLSSIFKESL